MRHSSMGKNLWLLNHRRKVTSENGEDGVIEKIFEIIGCETKTFLDVGAWNGRYLSNTWSLQKREWSGVLVEGDIRKVEEIKKNCLHHQIEIISAVVSKDQPLDQLLLNTSLPKRFDLLSLDIDGYDYWVWHGLKEYRPRVVVVEFNPTFGAGIVFIPSRMNAADVGSSMRAMVELALQKGYQLVCQIGANCIFVENQYFSKFNIENNSCEEMFVSPWAPVVAVTEDNQYCFLNQGPWGFSGFQDMKLLDSFECRISVDGVKYNLPLEGGVSKAISLSSDNASLRKKILSLVHSFDSDLSPASKICIDVTGYERNSIALFPLLEDFSSKRILCNGLMQESLDVMMRSMSVPDPFVLLSFGNLFGKEYWLWNSLKRYRPLLVVIPVDPFLPDNVFLVPHEKGGLSCVASLSSMRKMAQQKGYKLVEVIERSAVFVLEEKALEAGRNSVMLSSSNQSRIFPLVFASMKGIYYNLVHPYSEISGLKLISPKERAGHFHHCQIQHEKVAQETEDRHFLHIKRQRDIAIGVKELINAKADFLKEYKGSGWYWEIGKLKLVNFARKIINKKNNRERK